MRNLMIAALALIPCTALAQDDESLAGMWTASYRANYSSCADAKAGDVLAAQWIIGFSDGRLQIKATGPNQDDSYTGGGSGRSYRAGSEQRGRRVDVEFRAEGGQLVGRRIVLMKTGDYSAPCGIIYDIKARKL